MCHTPGAVPAHAGTSSPQTNPSPPQNFLRRRLGAELDPGGEQAACVAEAGTAVAQVLEAGLGDQGPPRAQRAPQMGSQCQALAADVAAFGLEQVGAALEVGADL